MKSELGIALVAMLALIGAAVADDKIVEISDPSSFASGDSWATVDSTPASGTTYTFVDNYAYADIYNANAQSLAGGESHQYNWMQTNDAYSNAHADATGYYARTYATSNTFAGPGVSRSSNYASSFSDGYWVQSTADSWGFAEAYGDYTVTDTYEYTNTYADGISGSSYSSGYASASSN